MVILGLLLIIAGAIAVLSALFVSEGRGELLGIDMSSLAIFLVGVAAGAAILWGFAILKWGTRRSLAHRRERREMSKRLDRAEAERRAGEPAPDANTPHGTGTAGPTDGTGQTGSTGQTGDTSPGTTSR